MSPSIVVIQGNVSEGTATCTPWHTTTTRHIPLERVTLHRTTYVAHRGHHVRLRGTCVATRALHGYGMTAAGWPGVVADLRVMLLLWSEGNTTRVLLGLFWTTCTAPHDLGSLFVPRFLFYVRPYVKLHELSRIIIFQEWLNKQARTTMLSPVEISPEPSLPAVAVLWLFSVTDPSFSTLEGSLQMDVCVWWEIQKQSTLISYLSLLAAVIF